MIEPFAKKGEVVTCENGHEVADVAEDLVAHTIMKAESLTNWRDGQIPARPYSRIQPCWCGAIYINDKYKLHFEDGWRPK